MRFSVSEIDSDFSRQGLQFLGIHHASEGGHQGGQRDGQFDMFQQPAQAFQRVGDALQKMGLLLVKTAKAIRAQRLHEADVNVGVVVVHEGVAVEVDESREPLEIVVEQLLAQFGRQVGLGIKQKRGDVVLQCAFAAALIVDEPGTGVAQHDVARLEIAIEEVIAVGLQQEFRRGGRNRLRAPAR